MKNLLRLSLAATMITAGLMAYDTKKAENAHAFFKNFTQQACAKGALFVDGERVMEMLRKKEDFLLLDIRTEGETGVVGVTVPNSLHIPLNTLFETKNLDRIPADKPVIIVCYSGTRAAMAATELKIVGFKNVQVLKGGINALAKANTPANAPLK